MKKIIPIIVIVLIAIISCDKIEGPYKEDVKVIAKDTVRKTVVMDFTGINCPNCTDGHRVIDTLVEKYGERIIPLAFHVPLLDHIDGYDFNLVSQAGTDFTNTYSFVGIPVGLINTMQDSLLAPLDWENKAVAYVNLDPSCFIKIENTYSNKNLNIIIETTLLKDISSTLNLVVYITETNITGPQNDNGTIVENYIHKHVVRGNVNTINGDEISLGAVKDEKITKTYNITIDNEWNENEVSVVAFIYNVDKEIIQAEEKHIIE